MKNKIEKLECDNNSFRDTFLNTEEQKNVLSEKLDELTVEKEKVSNSIDELLKEKEEIEVERELDSQRLKSEFETVLKDVENKLQEKEKEGYEIENEKKQLLEELNGIMESKKHLEFEIDKMNGIIQEQVQKIDELSSKIFGRDDDLRNKLDEVEKAREECKMLQESNNIVESEQEMFISDVLTKLEEITKILQNVEYSKKSLLTNEVDSSEDLDCSQDGGNGNEELVENNNNNEDALNEELNLSNVSCDSIDQVSARSNSEIITKFEQVKNLLLQKIGDIDSVISTKDFQINKSVFQTGEWKSNCEKIEKEATAIKDTFDGLLEMKEKDNQELRERNESIRNECNVKISALDKLQQDRLAGVENSDAYYREKVDFITNDFQKKSKEHEATCLENTKIIENLKQESNFLKNEIQSKERELSEMSRKYELSISQVEEREKELREENESYLSEEIDRIQHDCKNKLKKLEAEREGNETRLTREYEDKVTELEVAYEKLKADDSDVLRDDYERHLDDVSTQCEQLVEDKSSMEDLITSQKAEFDEELQKLRETLAFKVREFELLQAKYDAQHRLVDFVTLSLEQERAKKNNSNDEILNILEKLEQKVTETFQFPNDSNELYASESSINSMMTESLPESLYTNPLELNTTWPPKYNKREASPIRRWSSLGVLEQDQEKRKELIERLRAEISIQLNGMGIYPSANGVGNLSSSHNTSLNNKLPKPWSGIMEEDRNHLSPIDRSNGILSNKSYGKGLSSSSPSVRTTFFRNKISHDSGLDQNDDINELISYPNQLHNVIEMFKKLKEQHEQMKEENSVSFDRQWSVDLENWRNRVQYKIDDLKPSKAPSDRSDSALSTISSSSILFHPNDNEVKAIIENTNKMYDNAHFLL